MAAKIDWLYFRKGCTTCGKAEQYFTQNKVAIGETVLTSKAPHDRKMALALARKASKIVAAKGKKVVTLEMKDEPTDAEIEGLILGPTGNLRAPTFFKGKTMVVGFTPEAYDSVLTHR